MKFVRKTSSEKQLTIIETKTKKQQPKQQKQQKQQTNN